MKTGQKPTCKQLEQKIEHLTAQVNQLKAHCQEITDQFTVERNQAREAFATRLLYEQVLFACSPVLLANIGREEALTETLYEFLVATDVSRAYICKNVKNVETGQLCLQQTLEMCALQVAPQKNISPLCYENGLQRWKRELSRGKPLCGNLADFPQNERFFLEDREALNVLILPLWVEGQWYGFIGLDDEKQQREWKQEDVQLLQMGVDLVGSYIGRKQAERARKESEEKYRTLIEQSSDAIFLIHAGRFELINRQFTELFGITQKEASAPGFAFTSIIPASNQDKPPLTQVPPTNKQAKKHRPPYEFKAIDKHGKLIDVELTMSYPIYKRGLATQGIIRDISNRKLMEEEKRLAYEKIQKYANELAVKIKEEQYQREIAAILAEVVASVSLTLSTDELLNHILIRLKQLVPYDAAAIYLAKDSDLVLEAAHGANATFGHENVPIEKNLLFQEMQEKRGYILIPDTHKGDRLQFGEDNQQTQSWIGAPLLTAQEIMGYLAVHRHLPGAYKEADANLVQAFAHQVTQTIHNARLFAELKATQAQLVQRERLAALGQMSVTVAHELRNPLMSLRMGIDYLTFELPEDDSQHKAAALVEINMDRIVRVVENILFVAHTPKRTVTACSLHSLINDELSHWELKLLQKEISCTLDLAENLPSIFADFDQIERVLNNLIGNSLDAVEQGGELHVKLYQENGKQLIIVADNGSGISQEDQVKIFEPFFTTKSRGTGLGLAIVKQIIEGHGGQISVWSEPGHGTKFTVTLPQAG